MQHQVNDFFYSGRLVMRRLLVCKAACTRPSSAIEARWFVCSTESLAGHG
jgi:hypothetical protein